MADVAAPGLLRPRLATADARSLAVPGAAVLAVVLWLVAVHSADFSAMGSLGLVTVLGPAYYAGLAVTAGALCAELVQPKPRELVLTGLVVVLVLFLFGTACAVEPVASLASSWIHAGYVQYIYAHGHPLNGYDAEFSWPGAFSLGALTSGFMGTTSVVGLLRWFPFAIELAYLPALIAIARSAGINRRAAWLGVALFYATNWIYQDYFSPQAINLLFFLAVVALVLWTWRPVPVIADAPRGLADRARTLPRALRPVRLRGEESATHLDPRTLLGVMGVLVVMMAASSMSHQLTPYAILLALSACLLARRLGRPELVLVALVLAVGWLSLGASDYWLGHLSVIFGSFGNFLGTFGTNVTSRVTGSSSHRLIVDVRILLTAALFGLALLGSLRRACESRVLELLTVAQFVVLGAQNYGGEGLLRVALLAGPFASLLAASALLPVHHGPIPALLGERLDVPRLRLRLRLPWPTRRLAVGVAAAVVLCAFAVATTVVRGGNDAYEAFSSGEAAAAHYVYAHARTGQTVGIVAPYAPLGQTGVGTINVFAVAEGANVPNQRKIGTTLLAHSPRPAYVLLSAAQEAWGQILAGYPPGWEAALQRYLLAHGYVVGKRWSTATVLQLASLPRR